MIFMFSIDIHLCNAKNFLPFIFNRNGGKCQFRCQIEQFCHLITHAHTHTHTLLIPIPIPILKPYSLLANRMFDSIEYLYRKLVTITFTSIFIRLRANRPEKGNQWSCGNSNNRIKKIIYRYVFEQFFNRFEPQLNNGTRVTQHNRTIKLVGNTKVWIWM